MLIILNMQQRIQDINGDAYIPTSTDLIKNIKIRLNHARRNKETVIYGIESPVGLEKTVLNDHVKKNYDIIADLAPIDKELVIFKDSCAFSTANLGAIKAKWYKNFCQEKNNKIEVAGVELNRCVLANILLLKSVFSKSNFVIDRKNVYGPLLTKEAFAILENFDVEIRNK